LEGGKGINCFAPPYWQQNNITASHKNGRRHDIQHYDIKHDDSQHIELTCDTQHIELTCDTQHKCHSAQMTVSIKTFCIKCHYAGFRDLFIVMLNVMLNIIMLNSIMLSVVAPNGQFEFEIFMAHLLPPYLAFYTQTWGSWL
jgi:hypothetical protein